MEPTTKGTKHTKRGRSFEYLCPTVSAINAFFVFFVPFVVASRCPFLVRFAVNSLAREQRLARLWHRTHQQIMNGRTNTTPLGPDAHACRRAYRSWNSKCRSGIAKSLLLAAILTLARWGAAQPAEPPGASIIGKDAWTRIMPPPDLQGWTRIAIPPTNALGRAQWHLDEKRQVLVCDGDGGHEMLRFDRPLTNCIFRVECRFVPVPGGKTNYNSGLFIRNSADGTVWHQCQLTQDGGYLFGKTPSEGTLKRFKSAANEPRMKPVGEWNTVDVTAQGPVLTVLLNGAEVSRFTDCTQDSGYAALESEGYAIEFRNLQLKELH